jgi:hypothetical protein
MKIKRSLCLSAKGGPTNILGPTPSYSRPCSRARPSSTRSPTMSPPLQMLRPPPPTTSGTSPRPPLPHLLQKKCQEAATARPAPAGAQCLVHPTRPHLSSFLLVWKVIMSIIDNDYYREVPLCIQVDVLYQIVVLVEQPL